MVALGSGSTRETRASRRKIEPRVLVGSHDAMPNRGAAYVMNGTYT